MRVLHVVPSFFPAVRYGGPIASVRGLCEAIAAEGVEVNVATTDADGAFDLDVPTDRWTEVGGVRVRYFHRSPRAGPTVSLPLARFLARAIGEYDLVHITSTFSFPSLAAGIAARHARVQYVVSPRGNLQPWALSHRSWKKRPYWELFERRQLLRAAALHATAEAERDAILHLLPRARVVVVPNGMDPLPPPDATRSGRRLVFLGRIHRVKGFDVLVPALSMLAKELPDVETVVAGPDDDGEWARVEALLASAHPRPNLRYVGPVDGAEKFRLLASATAFVLPSHSENFGQAVLEALACETPVVVSRNCPWRAVEERGAGYWVENSPRELADALRAVILAGDAYPQMQRAARALADEYSWRAVGGAMVALYREVLDRGGHA